MSTLSQRNGADFEARFRTTCIVNGVTATRIPDGCRPLGRRLVRVKTPWDWVISHGGRTALVDTKTTLRKYFDHSAIDENQVRAMLPHTAARVPAGYVICLTEVNAVIYVSSELLSARIYQRGSIKATDPGVIPLGTKSGFDPRKIFRRAELTGQS